MKLFTIFLFLNLTVAFAAKAPTDDAELARKLVGVWITDPADKGQFVSITTYNADGTGTEVVRSRGQPESAGVTVTTSWSMKNGILTLKSVASSDPKRIPVGLELKDRVISISEDRFVFEAFEGYGDANGTRKVQVKKKTANKSLRLTRTGATDLRLSALVCQPSWSRVAELLRQAASVRQTTFTS